MFPDYLLFNFHDLPIVLFDCVCLRSIYMYVHSTMYTVHSFMYDTGKGDRVKKLIYMYMHSMSYYSHSIYNSNVI